MKKEPLILIGAGGHCKSCIDVIEFQNKYTIRGIIDVKEKIGQALFGYKIIGCDDDILDLIKQGYYFLITIGQICNYEMRVNIYNLIKEHQGNLSRIISPDSYVSNYAKIGDGTIIMHQVVINANVVIEDNCIINNKALIEHDAIIGKHCHISTGAIINGGVRIGAFTFFGSGAVCKQYIEIPERSFIKANSLVK